MSTARTLLLALAFTAGPVSRLCAQAPAEPSPPAPALLPIVVEKDITFTTVNEQKLQLDIARPKEGGPYPCIVCFHGGAWRFGNRKDLSRLIDTIAARGYVVATATYRLAPKATFPAQIEDARAAVKFLRHNAKLYHIDADRMGAMGYSAGAHLSLLLGTTDKTDGFEGKQLADVSGRVQCVVSFFGPTDMSLYAASTGLEDAYMVPFLGKEVKTDPKVYKRASPIEYVTKDDPPVLMIHGTFDLVVPIIHSERMLKKLEEAGVPAEIIKVRGEGHGFTGKVALSTTENAIDFFDKHLKEKK